MPKLYLPHSSHPRLVTTDLALLAHPWFLLRHPVPLMCIRSCDAAPCSSAWHVSCLLIFWSSMLRPLPPTYERCCSYNEVTRTTHMLATMLFLCRRPWTFTWPEAFDSSGASHQIENILATLSVRPSFVISHDLSSCGLNSMKTPRCAFQ